MQTKTYLNCPDCGFPVHSSSIFLKCPFCNKTSSMEVAMRGKVQVRGAIGERIAQGNGISWLPTLIAFGVGVVFGPTIMTASRFGAERMAKMAEEKLRKG